MQVKVITLAIPAMAMLAFAQTQDPSQTQQTTGSESRQQETRTETQTGTTTSQKPPRQSRTGETAKAHTYRGTLVDASCAQNIARTGMPGQAPSAERGTTGETGTTGAERSATEMGGAAAGAVPHVDAKAVSQSCPITSTTTDFSLVTSDGRLMQIDQAGDAKLASELKTNKKWSKDISSNKHITASVKGVLQGDTLQVESVK